ncbi:hypothetical protein Ait01nite_072300 [Actinoplanes italicus]|uniref:hypothetical protein n=1 Tax=Actinoplanes italicus TaxID=113567 RepID=UPI000D049E9F|nr:hypothetical protein [Actinoplanes italicus]GIE34185.1 hypothetical protein Ait01nite_072300 [Actinoplanes italicus]
MTFPVRAGSDGPACAADAWSTESGEVTPAGGGEAAGFEIVSAAVVPVPGAEPSPGPATGVVASSDIEGFPEPPGCDADAASGEAAGGVEGTGGGAEGGGAEGGGAEGGGAEGDGGVEDGRVPTPSEAEADPPVAGVFPAAGIPRSGAGPPATGREAAPSAGDAFPGRKASESGFCP